MTSARFLLLPALALASTLAAQATRVVPSDLANKSRDWPVYTPFEEGPARMQQIVDGSTFCNVTARISSVAFRGGDVRLTLPGPKLQNLKVTIGYAATTPKTMSLSWASNIQGTQTVVLNGSYNLPTLSPNDPPTYFPVEFKLPTPFFYLRTKGPLLIDIQNGDIYRLKRYPLDGDDLGNSSGWGLYGLCGKFPQTNGCIRFYADGRKMKLNPGGNASFKVDDVPRNWPALIAIGASKTKFGNLLLPFDLSLLGATKGNFLHVSLDIPIPIGLQLTNPPLGRYGASLTVPIPNSKGLTGATFYAQCFVFGGAGAFPMTASQGVSIKLPDDRRDLQMVFGDLNSQTGFYFSGSRTTNQPGFLGGCIVQLSGTFG